ncbi:uracil-DNA glycosylase [Sulfurimonas sp. MAG313]|nr:uracil-DNA glycosylase [Sulfurimonas sp. MAG313]MDF1880890.1 uracil-DNA glycosylase [Sulfurimonas sp. MAG313]
MNVFYTFFKRLQRRASRDQACNPYKNQNLLGNLKLYFEYLYEFNQNHILLIGEAPGYKGCRLTGIPFSSCHLIQHSQHKLFRHLREKIVLEESTNENTAAMIWEQLEDKHIIPIFWNAFPFHPFNKGNQKSNRAPNSSEIEEGQWYIKELIEIFEPRTIAAIGRKGELALNKLDLNKEIKYIRHPSYGGKSDFIKHINEVMS